MTLIGLIIALVIIGVVLWLINTFVPMDAKIKAILNCVVILVLALWLVNTLVGGSGILNQPIRIR